MKSINAHFPDSDVNAYMPAKSSSLGQQIMTAFCEEYSITEADIGEILSSKCIAINGRNIVVSDSTTLPGAVDIAVDIGIPKYSDREKIFADLLVSMFEQLVPGVCFGLNPANGRIFALISLHECMIDSADRVAVSMVMHVIDYIDTLHATHQFEKG